MTHPLLRLLRARFIAVPTAAGIAVPAAAGIAVLAAACGATDAAAQDEPAPIARASVAPGGAVVVGQPVTVGIEVLVPTFFRGAPAYDDIELEGAISFFNERGTNFTERIEGQTWAGQRRSYTIYANLSLIHI